MRMIHIRDVMCYVAKIKNIQRDIGKRGHPEPCELSRPRSWRRAIYLAVFVVVLSKE